MEKVTAPSLENTDLRPWRPVALTTRHLLYPQKLALTSPICCGRSVDIVRLRTKATELFFLKRAAVNYSRYYPIMFPEGLRKPTKNIRSADTPAGFRTGHLPNTSIKRYRYASSLGSSVSCSFEIIILA
jgi:hypothetical protein